MRAVLHWAVISMTYNVNHILSNSLANKFWVLTVKFESQRQFEHVSVKCTLSVNHISNTERGSNGYTISYLISLVTLTKNAKNCQNLQWNMKQNLSHRYGSVRMVHAVRSTLSYSLNPTVSQTLIVLFVDKILHLSPGAICTNTVSVKHKRSVWEVSQQKQ